MSTSRSKETAIGAAVALAATASMTGAAQGADLKVTNTRDHGTGSLRNRIHLANLTDARDHIVFRSRLTGEIALESDLPKVTGPVTVTGPGRNKLRINGERSFAIFDLLKDATITGLTLRGGHKDTEYFAPPCYGRCGGYYDSGPAGGAINIRSNPAVTVSGVRFVDNYGAFGGAISGYPIDLKVKSSVFKGNTSKSGGGAIHMGSTYGDSANLKVVDSTFTRNTATDYSGGAISSGGNASSIVRGSTFTANSASAGGAIAAYSQEPDVGFVITGSTIRNNKATRSGGGIELSGYSDISSSTITGNEAGWSGGGIYLRASSYSGTSEIASVSDSTISGNKSGTAGFIEGGGGGIKVVGRYGGVGPSVGLRNLTVAGNVATDSSGGGISAYIPDLFVDSTTISGNRVVSDSKPVHGGGIDQARGTTHLTNSIVSGNSSGSVNDLDTYSRLNLQSDEYPAFRADFSLLGKTGTVPVPTSVPGSNRHQVDPDLGKLTDNGGPTKTMLPRMSSLALDSGSTDLSTDQRGFRRPVNFKGVSTPKLVGANSADMGAVERQNRRKHKKGRR